PIDTARRFPPRPDRAAVHAPQLPVALQDRRPMQQPTRANLNAHDIAPTTQGTPTDKYIGMTGAQIFHEMMREQGVKHIFGYPGGAILPVFDAIHESKHFNFILTRHEQGAGHMAEGYARATGKVGVVLVTSGPGATNTVTAL